MIRSVTACHFLFDFLLLTFFFPAGTDERPRGESRPLPRPEAVAETRLLMEALMEPNFRGLEKLLGTRPANTESWTFARGQALLIAETSNLLMLRQPRAEGKEVWLQRAGELRAAATRLARAAAARDYDLSRSVLSSVANSCNRCHQTFRVPVRVTPFSGSQDKPVP
jgi:Cytochrome C'